MLRACWARQTGANCMWPRLAWFSPSRQSRRPVQKPPSRPGASMKEASPSLNSLFECLERPPVGQEGGGVLLFVSRCSEAAACEGAARRRARCVEVVFVVGPAGGHLAQAMAAWARRAGLWGV
eukprot:scaffold2285_cov126-Isochrysis_galbana.AAC.3